MKYLVLDTETTGLFNFSRPADEQGQPRLAHAHMIACDERGAAVKTQDFLIRPDHTWTDKDFADLESPGHPNPLTREMLMDKGVPISDVLGCYTEAMVEHGLILVAHNVQFDAKVMRAELRRAGMDDLFDKTPNICTMRGMAKIIGGKWPKLAEALGHIGQTLENAHSADADTEGARKLLEWMISNGGLPDAAVHKAKEGTKSGEARAAREVKPLPASKNTGPVPETF